MENCISSWLPASPFRSPAWRYLRASFLNEHQQGSNPRIDDEGVMRALRFLRATQRSEQLTSRPRSRPADRAVQEAFDVWQVDGPPRWRLEAYLLTKEALEEVARHCELSVATVSAYAQLFFACREHADARDWIALRAVGGGPWNNFANGRLDVLWKFFAFSDGPLALELVMAVTTDQPLPDWVRSPDVAKQAYSEARVRTACKLLIAAMTTASDKEFKELLKVHDQMRKLDGKVCGPRDGQAGMLPAMQKFLKLVNDPRGVRRMAGRGRGKSRRPAYDLSGAKSSRQRPSVAALREGLK